MDQRIISAACDKGCQTLRVCSLDVRKKMLRVRSLAFGSGADRSQPPHGMIIVRRRYVARSYFFERSKESILPRSQKTQNMARIRYWASPGDLEDTFKTIPNDLLSDFYGSSLNSNPLSPISNPLPPISQ
jgi:hypothetical protein